MPYIKQTEECLSEEEIFKDKDYQAALHEVDVDGTDTVRGTSLEPVDGQRRGKNGSVGDYERGTGKAGKSTDPRSLDAVVSRMPFRSRILYHVMPSNRKKQLTKHIDRRYKNTTVACQTDPWLMEAAYPTNDNPNY